MPGQRDEVKWILLCFQGQSNDGSCHGSRGRCPCVTVCASVSQVCCDLRTEEHETLKRRRKNKCRAKKEKDTKRKDVVQIELKKTNFREWWRDTTVTTGIAGNKETD